VKAFADGFQCDGTQQGEDKRHDFAGRAMGQQAPDRRVLRACNNRQHDPHQSSGAEGKEVMHNSVDDAGRDAGPKAYTRQTCGLSKVGVESRKVYIESDPES
jgi:hypothetical protein